MTVSTTEGLAKDLDLARVGVDEAGQQPHGRRLPGTVRSEEAVDDAIRHREVEPGQRGSSAVALAQVARREGEAGQGHPPE